MRLRLQRMPTARREFYLLKIVVNLKQTAPVLLTGAAAPLNFRLAKAPRQKKK